MFPEGGDAEVTFKQPLRARKEQPGDPWGGLNLRAVSVDREGKRR